MCKNFFFFGGGGGFQSVKIFRRFKFGMLRLTNWFVGDTNVICITETQSTLTLQNIAYPDFQNMNNFLYLTFYKTSGKF